MTTKDVQAQVNTRRVATTLMNFQRSQSAENPTGPSGKIFVHIVRARGAKGSLLSTHPDQPRASSHTNDNYCVNVLQTGLLAGSQETVKCVQLPEDLSLFKDDELSYTTDFRCKFFCCKSCTFCKRAFTKERCKSRYCNLSQNRIKIFIALIHPIQWTIANPAKRQKKSCYMSA